MKSRQLIALGSVMGIVGVLQGCVAVPATPVPVVTPEPVVYSPPPPVYTQPAPVYAVNPIDTILLGMTGAVLIDNLFFRDGWTYIHHQDRYGRWIDTRYRRGDYRQQLIQRHGYLMHNRQPYRGFGGYHQHRRLFR